MRAVYYVIAILLAAVLQTTLFQHLQIMDVKPLLLVAFAIIVVLQRGLIEGSIVGLSCGLMMDILGGNTIGINALSLLYICIFCGFLCEGFFKEKSIVVALFVFGANLVYELIYFILMFLIWGAGGFFRFFGQVIIIECIYTTLLAIPMFMLSKRINRRLEAREGAK